MACVRNQVSTCFVIADSICEIGSQDPRLPRAGFKLRNTSNSINSSGAQTQPNCIICTYRPVLSSFLWGRSYQRHTQARIAREGADLTTVCVAWAAAGRRHWHGSAGKGRPFCRRGTPLCGRAWQSLQCTSWLLPVWSQTQTKEQTNMHMALDERKHLDDVHHEHRNTVKRVMEVR